MNPFRIDLGLILWSILESTVVPLRILIIDEEEIYRLAAHIGEHIDILAQILAETGRWHAALKSVLDFVMSCHGSATDPKTVVGVVFVCKSSIHRSVACARLCWEAVVYADFVWLRTHECKHTVRWRSLSKSQTC